jgi:hypothetical protein
VQTYNFPKLPTILVIVCVLLLNVPGLPMGAGNGYAQTDKPETPTITEATTEKIDQYHQKTEKLLLDSAEWINNYFDTEISGRLKQTAVLVNYRRQIWRKWLYMEIAPQLVWYEERDFKTTAGIALRLEIFMGRYGSSG